jgi:hypothetical protein
MRLFIILFFLFLVLIEISACPENEVHSSCAVLEVVEPLVWLFVYQLVSAKMGSSGRPRMEFVFQ